MENLKKLKLFAVVFLCCFAVLTLIWYGILFFITLEASITMWDRFDRGVFAFGLLVFFVMSFSVAYNAFEDKNK